MLQMSSAGSRYVSNSGVSVFAMGWEVGCRWLGDMQLVGNFVWCWQQLMQQLLGAQDAHQASLCVSASSKGRRLMGLALCAGSYH
jgi:hypothetical protein